MPTKLETFFIESFCGKLFSKIYKYIFSEQAVSDAKKQLEKVLHTLGHDFFEKESQRIAIGKNDFYSVFPDLVSEDEIEEARAEFIENLKNGKYPLLYKRMKASAELFVQNYNALADRLNDKKEEIEKNILNQKKFSKVIGFVFDSRASLYGSSKATVVINTDVGRFFYKPHDCSLDFCFHELNNRFFSDIFKTPAVVKGSDEYGFCEFITNSVAKTESDASKFYENMGGLGAVLCFTQGSDCHVKNIFANNSYPVPIDLELIVSPSLSFNDFVLSLSSKGILPCQSLEGAEYSPLLNTEDKAFSCVPLINGKRKTVLEYEKQFKYGFERTFRYCLSIKDKLLEWAESLGEASIRRIFGQKQFHAAITDFLNSYKAILSEENQKKSKDMIYQTVVTQLKNEQVAEESIKIDSMGELPYFFSKMNSRSLFSSYGMEIENFYNETSLKALKDAVNAQNEDFLAFNLKLINQSFSDCIVKEDTKKQVLKENLTVKDRVDNLFLQIKDRFLKTPSGSSILIGQFNGNSLAAPKEIGEEGKLGIALFLKAYSLCYKDSVYGKEASVLADQLIEEVNNFISYTDEMLKLGDCDGLSGTLKCALIINRIEKNPKIDSLISCIYRKISEIDLEKCVLTDKYSGLSGLISVYCRFEELENREKTVINLADKLLSLKTLKDKDLLLWDTGFKKRALSGAGHGMIGIFQALFLAYKLTGKEEYKSAAMDAYQFEDSIYNDKLGSWPDLRDSETPKGIMHGFCSGAPGIGNILCSLYKYKDSIPGFDKNLERAVNSCNKQPDLYRDHLCCGNGSSADFMLDLYNVTGNEDYLEKAKALLIQQTEYAYLPATCRNSFALGFLFGASGVGYELLRLENPSVFESALV